MTDSPANKAKKERKGFGELFENNKFLFVFSMLASFLVWVVVAMYASPEESFTIYNVPITINTENSIVSQKGYVNFWQSDESVDVTVTGPRYLITSLTAEDIIVAANLNTVDSAGISEMSLKSSLKESSQDITISGMTKTTVEVYFDNELEKEFDINLDSEIFTDKMAEGFRLHSSELTVTSAVVKGPATEIKKIVSVVAEPQLPEGLLFETATIPVKLSLEGGTASETLSVNEYVEFVDADEYFVKVSICRITELAATVEYNGHSTGIATAVISPEVIGVEIDTEKGYNEDFLPILKVDYSALEEGENSFTVKASEIELPDGVLILEPDESFEVVINYKTAASAALAAAFVE